MSALTEERSQLLIRQWSHAHEEDRLNTKIFRPSENKFPPSRGRMSFNLKPNGQLVMTGPGRDDRPSSSEGTWNLKDQNLLFHFPDGREKSYKILEIDPDYLELEEINS